MAFDEQHFTASAELQFFFYRFSILNKIKFKWLNNMMRKETNMRKVMKKIQKNSMSKNAFIE